MSPQKAGLSPSPPERESGLGVLSVQAPCPAGPAGLVVSTLERISGHPARTTASLGQSAFRCNPASLEAKDRISETGSSQPKSAAWLTGRRVSSETACETFDKSVCHIPIYVLFRMLCVTYCNVRTIQKTGLYICQVWSQKIANIQILRQRTNAAGRPPEAPGDTVHPMHTAPWGKRDGDIR